MTPPRLPPSRCAGFPAHLTPDAPTCRDCGLPAAAHERVTFGAWTLPELARDGMPLDGEPIVVRWRDETLVHVYLDRGGRGRLEYRPAAVVAFRAGPARDPRYVDRKILDVLTLEDAEGVAAFLVDTLLDGWECAGRGLGLGTCVTFADLDRRLVVRALLVALVAVDREELAAHRDVPASPPPEPLP